MKKTLLAIALVCSFGLASAQYISNFGGTTTVVTVTSTNSQVLAANVTRRSLLLENVGVAAITCVTGTTAAVAGQGIVLEPNASGAGHQGGALLLNGPTARDAVQCIVSSTSSTLTILEGN